MKPFFRLILFVASVAGLLLLSGGVHAQTAPSVSAASAVPAAVQSAQTSTFESHFADLSQKYQTAILCESAPYQAVLSPDSAAKLQADLAASAPGKTEQITLAARAFDYEPVFVDSRTVLLLKRYTNPKDLPEVSLGEVTLFVNNLLKAIGPLLPAPGETQATLLVALLHDTAPQEAAAYADGVPWSRLPPWFQNRWVFLKTAEPLFLAAQSLEALSHRLKEAGQTGRVVFTREKDVPLMFSAADNLPLKVSFFGQLVPASEATNPARPLLASQKSLGQLATDASGKGVRVEAPDALKEKTTCLFGGERYLSPVETMKAVAQIYGFRAALGADNVVRIVLPSVRPLTDFAQVDEEVVRLMPTPVLRALRSPSETTLRSASGKTSRMLVSSYSTAGSTFVNGPLNFWNGKIYQMHSAAAELLRHYVRLPEVKAGGAKEKSVSLSDLPNEAQNAIALYSLFADSHALIQIASIRSYASIKPDDVPHTTFKATHVGEMYSYEVRITPAPGKSDTGRWGGSFGRPQPR